MVDKGKPVTWSGHAEYTPVTVRHHAVSTPRLVYAWEGEVAGLHAEIERLRTDLGIVLAQIDGLVETTGEDLDAEDRAIREQIRSALTPAEGKGG